MKLASVATSHTVSGNKVEFKGIPYGINSTHFLTQNLSGAIPFESRLPTNDALISIVVYRKNVFPANEKKENELWKREKWQMPVTIGYINKFSTSGDQDRSSRANTVIEGWFNTRDVNKIPTMMYKYEKSENGNKISGLEYREPKMLSDINQYYLFWEYLQELPIYKMAHEKAEIPTPVETSELYKNGSASHELIWAGYDDNNKDVWFCFDGYFRNADNVYMDIESQVLPYIEKSSNNENKANFKDGNIGFRFKKSIYLREA